MKEEIIRGHAYIKSKEGMTYLIHAQIDHFLLKISYFFDVKIVKQGDTRNSWQRIHHQIIHYHVCNHPFHVPSLTGGPWIVWAWRVYEI